MTKADPTIPRQSRTTRRVFITTGLAVSALGPALAQGTWPDRPLRFFVGFAPGELARGICTTGISVFSA